MTRTARLAAALAVALVPAVGTATAHAATTAPAPTVNAFTPVLTNPAPAQYAPTPSAITAVDADSAYVADLGGAAGISLVRADGRATRVTTTTGATIGMPFEHKGGWYAFAGTALYSVSGATATPTTTLAGRTFTLPTSVPGITPASTAPLELTFVKAVDGVLYFSVEQQMVPESPGHYWGYAAFDGSSWTGALRPVATDDALLDVEVAGRTVALKQLARSSQIASAYTLTAGTWVQSPRGFSSKSGVQAYTSPTDNGDGTQTLWGHTRTYDWLFPDDTATQVPLKGICTSTGAACTPPAWGVSAATRVAGGAVVLGGLDDTFTSPASMPKGPAGGFAVVPRVGAAPVAIGGDNDARVVALDATSTTGVVWAITATPDVTGATGGPSRIQRAVIDPAALGGAPVPTPTPTPTPTPKQKPTPKKPTRPVPTHPAR